MKPVPRAIALIAGAVLALGGPVVVWRVWRTPPDPRISVGAAAPASLLPGDARDATGRMLAGAVWTGLVELDPRTGTPIPAAAESVTSDDRRVWTVRLRAGGRFHDGSPVTAGSFAGAWTAALREGWAGARLLTDVARIRGARRAADPGGPNADQGKPAAEAAGSVSGLEVTGELTFRVTLERPLSGFPALLAEPAFMPLPEAALRARDWPAFQRRPVGNGPLRVLRRDAGEITLTPTAGAGGRRRDVVVRMMPATRQYAAVRDGALDVATAVPGAQHELMSAEFPGRHLVVPGRSMTYLAFPAGPSGERFASPALRKALSLAINRGAVTEGALAHQATAAGSALPPGIALGRRDRACRLCLHDGPAGAAALTEAGGLTGPVPLWYDARSGDARWVAAVVRQLRSGLRLDVRPHPVTGPGTGIAGALARGQVDGPYALHVTADYASPVAVLERLPGDRSDPYLAGQLDRANGAARPQDAVIPARLAETVLLRDLTVIPLWSAHDHLVWSQRVSGVAADAFGGLRLDRLTAA